MRLHMIGSAYNAVVREAPDQAEKAGLMISKKWVDLQERNASR